MKKLLSFVLLAVSLAAAACQYDTEAASGTYTVYSTATFSVNQPESDASSPMNLLVSGGSQSPSVIPNGYWGICAYEIDYTSIIQVPTYDPRLEVRLDISANDGASWGFIGRRIFKRCDFEKFYNRTIFPAIVHNWPVGTQVKVRISAGPVGHAPLEIDSGSQFGTMDGSIWSGAKTVDNTGKLPCIYTSISTYEVKTTPRPGRSY